jgi:hypothetical protein
MKKNERLLTLGQAVDAIGCGVHTWHLRRVYERGFLPHCRRAGQNRVIGENELPALKEALRKAGYLKEKVTA